MSQRTSVRVLDDVAVRLRDEFAALSRARVDLCVTDTGRCLANLGHDVAPVVVERLARERLHAVVNSSPPSGLITPIRPNGHDPEPS
ncbi:hypothetical protein [Halostreptopolyspora alba]|uniref:Uncharacterized protein n=1 Tax=Halostreptopolyspora alba TaxID=2487137 RepID=A0A3N0EI95_9ACTN|nr:hypothetical protein EFW17_02135 [Nocardiopsaceae bacterium YIM 96095]